MKKKQVTAFAVISALAATTMLSGASVSAKPAPAVDPALAAAKSNQVVFSAAATDPDLVENMRAQGKQVKQPSPKGNYSNGSRFAQPSSPQPLPQGIIEASQKNLALLVKFPQENGHSPVPGSPDERIPANLFGDLLYGTSYNPYVLPQFAQDAVAPNGQPAPLDRTLKNYWKEVSYGKVDVGTYDSPENIGWITAPHPYSYYFGGGAMPTDPYEYNANGFGNYPHNVQGLVEDVLKAADPYVDFSKYAINGEVPGVFIIHEGSGAEWSLDPQQIWSHKWQIDYVSTDGVNYVPHDATYDGVKVAKYSIEPEIGGNVSGFDGVGSYDPAYKTGPFAPQVGVYAHEFAHVLGLPDLYDYGYDSNGVGAWSVMAGGSWARYPNFAQYAGNTPVHLDAWDKYFAGFLQPTEVSMSQITNGTLPSVEDNPTVYKVTVPKTGGSEYFLFENRQLKGYDLGLTRYGGVTAGTHNNAMHGMLAYHVDDNVLYRNFWRPNEGQDANPQRTSKSTQDTITGTGEWHYGVGVVQADGLFQLETGMSSGNAGDLYPGTTKKTDLTFTNNFYSGSYYNNTPFFKVQNITEANGVINAQFVPVP